MNISWKLTSSTSILLLLYLGMVFTSCKSNDQHDGHKQHTQSVHRYICPMHCEGEKTYDQPRNCPVCNMKLQLVEKTQHQSLSSNNQVYSRQATVKLQSSKNNDTLTVQGYIDLNRSKSHDVAARFSGRIEKIFVSYPFQFVKKGEKILELYSPEFNTIQEQYLFLFKNEEDKNLLQQSREKLQFFGISEKQILALEEKESFTKSISVFSPTSGYIFFNSEVQSYNTSTSSLSNSNGMGMPQNMPETKTEKPSGLQIREGMYINKGDKLFSVNDLKSVWAILSLPSEHQTSMQINQPIPVFSELYSNQIFSGRVQLTEQTFEEKQQRFIRLRLEVPNEQAKLKLNSFVKAKIPLSTENGNRIPATAVFHTGLNAYVWVKVGKTEMGTGIFELRKVTIGARNAGVINILNGLATDEEVALHAGSLTDSETFLNRN